MHQELSGAISSSSQVLLLRIVGDRWKQKPWKEDVAHLFFKKMGGVGRQKCQNINLVRLALTLEILQQKTILQAPKKPATAAWISQGQRMSNNAFYARMDPKHSKEIDIICCIFTWKQRKPNNLNFFSKSAFGISCRWGISAQFPKLVLPLIAKGPWLLSWAAFG